MMQYLTGSARYSGLSDAINRCSQVCESLSPRLTAGTKIVAAGLLLAAPCELLLPASLLSSDVRRFFSRNWQIVKTGQVLTSVASGRSWSDRMLQKNFECNIGETHIVIRWVVSRAMGSLGVTGAATVDTIRELALAVLIGVYALGTTAGTLALKIRVNPLKLEHATGQDALIHLRDAGIHAVTVVVAPVLGLIAPTMLLTPVMTKINLSDAKKSPFQHDRVKCAGKISNKQLILLGAAFLGLTTVAYTTGALSALKAVVLPLAPNAVTFPLTRKLGAMGAGIFQSQGSGTVEDLINNDPDLAPYQKRYLIAIH